MKRLTKSEQHLGRLIFERPTFLGAKMPFLVPLIYRICRNMRELELMEAIYNCTCPTRMKYLRERYKDLQNNTAQS